MCLTYVCNSINVILNSFKSQPRDSVSCYCLTGSAWSSLPSRPFSTTTLMKWSCLTNTSRASREPRPLPAAAATERLNGNEYQHDLCCSFHSLLFSLFHTLCVSADSSTLLRWCDLTLRSGWDVCHISGLTVWNQQNLSYARKATPSSLFSPPFLLSTDTIVDSLQHFRFNVHRFSLELKSIVSEKRQNSVALTDGTFARLRPGPWVMNICTLYAVQQFPLDGICRCLVFYLPRWVNADFLEREKQQQTVWGNNLLVLWNESVTAPIRSRLWDRKVEIFPISKASTCSRERSGDDGATQDWLHDVVAKK